VLPENVIEVSNKIDRLDAERKAALKEKGALMISAVTGEGVDILLARLESEMGKRFFTRVEYTLPVEDGKSMAWLHAHGKVVEQTVEEDYIRVVVQLSEDNIRRFESLRHAGSA
jgi:GTP-binding protein HflX